MTNKMLRAAASAPAYPSELSLAEQLADLPPHLHHERTSSIHSQSSISSSAATTPSTTTPSRSEPMTGVVIPAHIPEVVPVQMKAKMLKAVKAAEYSMVWALLAKGANPNECEDVGGAGWSPLHWAAKDGSVAICQLLVSKGADVNTRDRSGQTPLHRAAYWGKIQVVDFLVYVGASLEAVDAANLTPADVARQRNNQDVYAFLKQQTQQVADSKKTHKAWNVRRQFEQLLKDQAKEDKLIKRNMKLEDKAGKLTKELTRCRMLQEELQKRGKQPAKKDLLKAQRLDEKIKEINQELHKNLIEVSMSRCETFEKHASDKSQTWQSFLEEL